jgi:hypothetical protein
MEAKVAEESHGEGGLVPDGIGEQLLLGHCRRLLTSSLGGRLYIGLPESLLIILLEVWSVIVANTLSIHLNTFSPNLSRNIFC